MPRNSAGNYTLPLPPVVTGTTITSNFENSTDADIATELTNSLDRSGRGGMLAPFKLFDGTVSAPGLSWILDPTNGLYRIGSNNWAAAVGGAKVMEFTVNGVIIPANVSLNVGGDLHVSDTAGPYSPTVDRTYVIVRGRGTGTADASGNVQLVHNRSVDQDGTVLGNVEWIDPLQSAANKRVGYIGGNLHGTVANARGFDLSFATRRQSDSAAREVMRLCRGSATVNEPIFAFDYPSFPSDTWPNYFGFFGNGTRAVLLKLYGNGAFNSPSGLEFTDANGGWAIMGHQGGTMSWSYPHSPGGGDATYFANSAMRLNGGGSGLARNTVLTLSGLTATLYFSDLARIRADMSAALASQRLAFQSSITDGNSNIGIMPNGAGNVASLAIANNSDPDNSSFLHLRQTILASIVNASKAGTGLGTDLVLQTNSLPGLQIDRLTQNVTISKVVSSYNGVATVGLGLAPIVARFRAVAQSAAIVNQVIVPSAPVDGFYRLSMTASITTPGTTSILGGANSFTVTATDPLDSVAKTTKAALGAAISNVNTTAVTVNVNASVYAKAGTPITFSYDYTSTGTPMQYALRVMVELLGLDT
jgi:hypothetical protein